MSLRIATLEDYDLVRGMVLKFAEASYPEFDIEEYKLSETLHGYFRDNEKAIVVLAGDHAMIAGTCSETIFNSEKVVQETMWWCEPEYRTSRVALQLPDALEFWARKLNARWLNLCSVRGPYQERVNNLYLRKGFNPLEHTFIKDLKCQLF